RPEGYRHRTGHRERDRRLVGAETQDRGILCEPVARRQPAAVRADTRIVAARLDGVPGLDRDRVEPPPNPRPARRSWIYQGRQPPIAAVEDIPPRRLPEEALAAPGKLQPLGAQLARRGIRLQPP